MVALKKEQLLNFIVSFTLLIIFLRYFGIPTLTKCRDNAVQNNENTVPYKKEDSPSITICPQNNLTWSSGWRKLKHKNVLSYDDNCGNQTTKENLYSCIDENTYNLTEIVESGSYKIDLSSTELFWGKLIQELGNTSMWKPDIRFSFNGKCFTSKKDIILEKRTSLKITFKKSLGYQIFIHPSSFFLISNSPLTVPRCELEVNSDEVKLPYLEVYKHSKLDRDSAPCNNDPDYSFTVCIRNWASSQLGCK